MANKDFTSKKTQIIGMKNPIKKVFRVREGGVTVTSFKTKKGDGNYTYDVIPKGTLLVVDEDGEVFPAPIKNNGTINFQAETFAIIIGFTINEVTPEKPQASVMTWGVINPKCYELVDNYPIDIENKKDWAFMEAFLMSGIFVSFEADELVVPKDSIV